MAACTTCGILAVSAVGALDDALVGGVTGELGAGPSTVVSVGETDTVESVVSPLQGEAGGVQSTNVVQPAVDTVASIGTAVEPVTSTIGAAAGAAEAVLSSAAGAAGSVVAEPPAGGGQPGGAPEVPPIEPPPVAPPTPGGPPAPEPPPVGSEPEPRPVGGSGATDGSSPERSDVSASAPAISSAPSSEGSAAGGSAIELSAGALAALLVWPAPSTPTASGEPAAGPGFGLPPEPGVLESVTVPAVTLSAGVTRSSANDGLDGIAAPSGAGWVPPLFELVDPRAPIGAVVFVVLGLGALSLAMAGIPRRAYAGVGLTQESAFALRVTLGCAGLVLVGAASIGQLAA